MGLLMRINTLKKIGLMIVVILVVVWLSLTIATELMRHQVKTMEWLAGIESIKHWLILVRLVVYFSLYKLWGTILRHYKPTISDELVTDSRNMMLRFCLVYEIFIGINILEWIMR